MSPEDFRAWRDRMGWSRIAAKNALGIGLSTLDQYERGHRRDSGAPVVIPRSIALACAAVEAGLPPVPYDEEPLSGPARKTKRRGRRRQAQEETRRADG